ncbi:hypothetical protein KP509_14G053700 [Ceratopteris richardii]|uniref:Cytochrome b5 heme-binding domain-containing protein n=1 Tax=Ceratopteris richardii TaxID=49495 RepID=A0A8T2T7Y4_CERRI|nr:hypothetical protein KP509_14G053700 [Ceratopteris richardii]KAH7415611.1 hypothetical protein KP509_14G053700 [Ceratopteris richardii]
MSKIVAYTELAEHATSEDCWILISGKVYDVTKFLDEHPGGDDVILSATGKDATDDFEDVGHSKTARDMLTSYYIGDIDPSTVTKKRIQKFTVEPVYEQDKSKEFYIRILQFIVPIGILGLAFVVRHYTKAPA